MKKVSVVMCTYNGEAFLREQLDSILAQTYPIHELLIQDDCSTDRTLQIIREYAQRYPIIRLCQNSQNLGFNRNFREALLKATGELIAVADQDDIWYPNKIEAQVNAIGEHDVCISAYHTGTIFREDRNMRITIPIYRLEYLLFYDSTPGHSMLLRNDFVQYAFKRWDGHILYDWWFSVNGHLRRGIICVNTPLNWHRPHNQSAITQLNAKYASYLTAKPTWQPYIQGFRKFRKQQQLPSWKFFYGYIHRQTVNGTHPLAHTLSGLLLKRDFVSLLRLCFLCMKNKHSIYFTPNSKGVMSYIRAFFYPMIRAYGNTYFYL